VQSSSIATEQETDANTALVPEASTRLPAFYRRRKKRGDEIGQVLLRLGRIRAEDLREALRIQEESGGLIGNILKRLGACDSQAIAEALIEQARLARTKGKNFLAPQARANPSVAGLSHRCRPQLVAFLLMVADTAAVLVGASLVWLLTLPVELSPPERYGVAGLVPLCLAAYSAVGLYGVLAPSPPQEIRNLTVASTLVFIALWTAAVLARDVPFGWWVHVAWLVGLAATWVLVPVSRSVMRARFARRAFWGQPVVVLGAGKVSRALVGELQRRPELGLRPVAILDQDKDKLGSVKVAWGESDIALEPVSQSEARAAQRFSTLARAALERFAEIEGVPVMGGFDLAPVLAQRLGIRSAVIALPELDTAGVHAVIERYADGYTSVLVIPDLYDLAHFGAPTRYLGGKLGIEVQRQLLLRWPRITKRLLDVSLTGLALLAISPLLALIAVAIRLDSRGPVFYSQKRLGQDGVRFRARKFRTMYGDGEARLQEVLAKNPKLAAEYEQFHKLTDDPRVTRVGRVLRKYSLDELPQLWNVLVGDMSLVGPRPYIEREIAEMGGRELTVLRVKPGITGYWQVTERNASTFEHRVKLDVEYVRSWSPWLDLYVIAKTVPVVLGGTGS
jgi:Undecaprenyl-phosphate galactose phosphotransferase WbaP